MSGTHRTCEICGIKERHCDGKLFFARFPLDKHRCSEWLRAVGKEDLAYLLVEKLHDLRHICQKHFSKKDFTKTKTRLKKRAVPKLELSAPPLTDEILATFLQLNENAVMESSTSHHNLITVASAVPAYKHNAEPSNSQCTDFSPGTPDPPEPVGLQFSWQETSLVALDDEPNAESAVLPTDKSEVVRNVKNYTELVKDTATSEATDYRCDACQNNISGYTCVQCDDYDLCGTCEANLIHPQHYMLRVPGLRLQREVKSIIEIIKRKLKILEAELRNDGIAGMDWDVEIKKEEDPFEEATSETIQHHIEDTNLKYTSGHSEVPDVSNQLDNTHKKQMEQNRDRAYDSKSEYSDISECVLDNEKQEEEWLEEFLLDNSDDVDSGCDSYKKLTLINDLQFEESARNEGIDTKLQDLPHKQTYKPVQNITAHLKSEEGSVLLNPKKKVFQTTYKVLNLLKSRPNVECMVYKNHEHTNRHIIATRDTQLCRSSNEGLKYTCKRNANVSLDEALVDDVSELARSSNVTSSKTIVKSTGVHTGIKVASKRFILSSLDTEQLKESTKVADSKDRHIPLYNVNLRKRVIIEGSDDRNTLILVDNENTRKRLIVRPR